MFENFRSRVWRQLAECKYYLHHIQHNTKPCMDPDVILIVIFCLILDIGQCYSNKGAMHQMVISFTIVFYEEISI